MPKQDLFICTAITPKLTEHKSASLACDRACQAYLDAQKIFENGITESNRAVVAANYKAWQDAREIRAQAYSRMVDEQNS